MTHETKITPALAQVLTDEHESGATFRELERKHGVSRTRIGVHVKREQDRRAAEREAIEADRRERADIRRQARAEQPPARRPRRIRFDDGLSRVLDENDAVSDLRAERRRERGLHPLRASQFQTSATDAEWADYLANRTQWPPGVDPARATRRWKLGTATETVIA